MMNESGLKRYRGGFCVIKRVSVLPVFVVTAVLLQAGCSPKEQSSSAPSPAPAAKPAEPITLKFYTMQNSNYAQEGNFADEIGNVVKAKFPHITLQHVHSPKYEDLIAANDIPDILLETSSSAGVKIKQNGLAFDLAELIQTERFDLSRIHPALLDQLKASSGDGKLYGLPFTGSNFILFYNKDLFNKFGVPYPNDNMTWDDAYDLTKKLARMDGGIPYIGFALNSGLALKYSQLSLNAGAPKENKGAVLTDDWKRLFETYKRFYDIPNNSLIKVDEFPKGQIAMTLHITEKLTAWPQQAPNLNWDVVAAPTFPNKPNTGFQPNVYSLFVTSQSKYKEQAFEVVASLLSDEVQTYLSKKGYVTPLVNKDVQQVVGQNVAGLQGKNVRNAIYAHDYAEPPQARDGHLIYVDIGGGGKFFDDMIKNGEDVNTTLRKWNEDIELKLNQTLNQNK